MSVYVAIPVKFYVIVVEMVVPLGNLSILSTAQLRPIHFVY
jgi:hypothetical protein